MALKGKPVAISNSATTIYTCPATKEAAVHGLIVGNNTGNQLAVTISVYNQADNTTTAVVSGLPVPANNFITWGKPINLNAGDAVQLTSSAATGMVALYSVYEDGATPAAQGFVGRGYWTNSANYDVNDIVSVSGQGTYVAIQASTNQDPTTATSYWMFLEGISSSALPAQSGQSGKYLTTDGTNASWGALDSTALNVDMAMAAGGSLTAARAVAMNAAGEVGVYPNINEITETSNANSNIDNNVYLSRNGSVGVWLYNEGNVPNTSSNRTSVYGFGVSTSGSFSYSTPYIIDVTTSGASGSNQGHWVFCNPTFNNDGFSIISIRRAQYSTTNDGYSRLEFRTVSVSSAGTVTQVSSSGFSENWGSYYWQGSFSHALYEDKSTSKMISVILRGGTSSDGNGYGYTWTVTNNSGSLYTDGTGTYYSNAISDTTSFKGNYTESARIFGGTLVKYGTTQAYASTYSGGDITSAPSAIGNSYSSDYHSHSTRASYGNVMIHVYRTTAFQTKMEIFELDNSGVPTFVDSTILNLDATTDSSSWQNPDITFKNETEFVLSYLTGGIYRINSIKLNNDYTYSGKNFVTTLYTNPIWVAYTGVNDEFIISYKNNDGHILRRYKVNGFETSAFSFVGFSPINQTSNPASVTVAGKVSGFTGLEEGEFYYLADTFDGQITTSNATNMRVGKAISEEEIIVGDVG
jgi:hypothetical protein